MRSPSRHPIHDDYVVASLKLQHVSAAVEPRRVPIHDDYVVASLKRSSHALLRAPQYADPRRLRRGLIEASCPCARSCEAGPIHDDYVVASSKSPRPPEARNPVRLQATSHIRRNLTHAGGAYAARRALVARGRDLIEQPLEKQTVPLGRGTLQRAMGVPATKPATSDARRRYLEDPRPMEIHRGVVRAAPTATEEHNTATTELVARLKAAGRSGLLSGWKFVTDVDMDFQLVPEEVRAPDVAGYRRERWLPAWRDAVPIPEPTNWLCEVWSPGDSQQDREDLMSVYHQADSVEYVWTIDRALPALKVFRRGPTTWRRELVIDALDVAFEAPPFLGVSLTLGALLDDD